MLLEGNKCKVPLGNWLEAPHRKCSAQHPWQGCIPAQSGTCRAAGMRTLFWGQQRYPGGCASSYWESGWEPRTDMVRGGRQGDAGAEVLGSHGETVLHAGLQTCSNYIKICFNPVSVPLHLGRRSSDHLAHPPFGLERWIPDNTFFSWWRSAWLALFCRQIPVHCHLSNNSPLCNSHANPCVCIVWHNIRETLVPSTDLALKWKRTVLFSASSPALPRLKLVQIFSWAAMESIQVTTDMSWGNLKCGLQRRRGWLVL